MSTIYDYNIERDLLKILNIFKRSAYFYNPFEIHLSRNIENLFLNKEVFDQLNNEFLEINDFNNQLYKIYNKSKKRDKKNDTYEYQFVNYFKNLFSKSIQISKDSNWICDSRKSMFRKESVISALPNGYELYKENYLEFNSLILATTSQPQFDFTFFEGSESYMWIFSRKYRFDFTLVRFYFCFHPEIEKVKVFIQNLTSKFDEALIPFALKFHSDPEEYYRRSDCCVLYVPRKYSILTFGVMSRICRSIDFKNFFVEDKPLFTKKIFKGISFGEDPDEKIHLSFGTYKCAIITLSLYKLKKRGKANLTQENLISEINKFDPINFNSSENSEDNNWINRFYLNKSSIYDYSPEMNYFRNSISKKLNKESENEYLNLAKQIGSKLVSDAFWFENQKGEKMNCNWVAFQKTSNTDFNEFKVLDNDFINGRLGISFFLRKLYDELLDYKEFDTASFRAAREYLDFKTPSNETKWFVRNSQFWEVGWTDEKFDDGTSQFEINRNNHFVDIFSAVDEIISGISMKIDKNNLDKIIDEIKLYLDEGKPFYLFETDEVFPTFNGGLAYFGYFFLKLARPKITNIPLKINYID